MVGFVGLLSCALAAIFLVFVVMFLALLQAQLAPTEGNYKLATESGLVFPVEGHYLSDELFLKMMGTFRVIYGNEPVYATTSCVVGAELDTVTAKRYSAYNFVFLKSKQQQAEYSIAYVDHLPNAARDSPLSDMCYVALKTKALHDRYERAAADKLIEQKAE